VNCLSTLEVEMSTELSRDPEVLAEAPAEQSCQPHMSRKLSAHDVEVSVEESSQLHMSCELSAVDTEMSTELSHDVEVPVEQSSQPQLSPELSAVDSETTREQAGCPQLSSELLAKLLWQSHRTHT
jgi:hypothetical protein